MNVVKIKHNKSFVILSIIFLSIISAFIGALFMKFIIGDCGLKDDIVEEKQICQNKEVIKDCSCKSNENNKKINIADKQLENNNKEVKNNIKTEDRKDLVIIINSKSIVKPKYVNNKPKPKQEIKKKNVVKKKTIKKKEKKPEIKVFITPKKEEIQEDVERNINIREVKRENYNEEQEIHNKIIFEEE